MLKGDEKASKGIRHLRATGRRNMQQRGVEEWLKRDNKALKGDRKVLNGNGKP